MVDNIEYEQETLKDTLEKTKNQNKDRQKTTSF